MFVFFLSHFLTDSQQNSLQSEGDHLYPGLHKGYPVTKFPYPTTISVLRLFDPLKCTISRDLGKPTGPDNFQTTYDWTSRMLDVAVSFLVALKGRVKVEVVCAEFFSELQLMRNGEDHHRPKEFPRSFLRIWTSGIP